MKPQFSYERATQTLRLWSRPKTLKVRIGGYTELTDSTRPPRSLLQFASPVLKMISGGISEFPAWLTPLRKLLRGNFPLACSHLCNS